MCTSQEAGLRGLWCPRGDIPDGNPPPTWGDQQKPRQPEELLGWGWEELGSYHRKSVLHVTGEQAACNSAGENNSPWAGTAGGHILHGKREHFKTKL